MNEDLLDRAFRAAQRMADDRGLDIDSDELMDAVRAVTGKSAAQDEPDEIAEDAIELLGKAVGTRSPRRRPF